MTTHIIGIAGKEGYGKSTIANLIKDLNGANESTFVCSFADPIRSNLLRIFPQLTPNHFKDRKLKEKEIMNGTTPRRLMREFAEDFVKKHDPDVFVKHAEHSYRELCTKSNPYRKKFSFVVFDDVRFENEVNFIRRYNGTIIHLDRKQPEPTGLQRLVKYFHIEHTSNIGVAHLYDDKTDWIINTDEPIAITRQRIMQLQTHRFDKRFEL